VTKVGLVLTMVGLVVSLVALVWFLWVVLCFLRGFGFCVGGLWVLCGGAVWLFLGMGARWMLLSVVGCFDNKVSIFMCFLLFFLQSFWAMEVLGSSCKGLVLSVVALGLGFGGPLNWGQLEYCRPSGPYNMYKE
jgi:hypothetical protein